MLKNNKLYIDEDTYKQITLETKEDYIAFLKRNSSVVDLDKNELVEKSQEVNEKEPVISEELSLKHKKDEDHRYIFHLFWLEQYLPRFELAFGKFNYSKEDLSNKEKCEELKDYFENKCKINSVEEIRKRSFHTMKEAVRKGHCR